ncbi:MAG TPA: TolC family protein [Gemmataceae bacterium]|nr:TolC family protein [Gemmataceae bacterium]
MKRLRRIPLVLAFALLPGCWLPSHSGIEGQLKARTAEVERSENYHARDPLPAAPVVAEPLLPDASATAQPEPSPPAPIQRVAFAPQEDPPQRTPHQLFVPPELPGADAPPIEKMSEEPAEKARQLKALYPPLPPLPAIPRPALGPVGRPLSLADLQSLGETYSPAVKGAYAAVEAANGAARQAGAYPNPTLGYEHDTVETGSAGYPGFFIDQVIKTGDKLKLQEAAATMDLLNARLALRRARTDLAYQVRGAYFAVLVAQENMRVSEALYRFTNEIYTIQIDIVKTAGLAAGYEPMQLRPLALQARLAFLQARNQYLASWKQLAAAMGLPDMPPSELQGRVDLPVPVFDHDAVVARLDRHTDVLTAYNTIQKAKYQLEFAKVTPLPDVDVRLLVQKDYTTPPNQISHSFQMTLPVPVWDQNKGAIHQAEWLLRQVSVGPDQARNALITTLADAFNRYQTARETVAITRQQVRDQVRAFRRIYDRWHLLPADVKFGDVVTAEQTLATYIAAYVTALGQQWQAVVDVANLLQTDDLFQVAPHEEVFPVPDLEPLPPPVIIKPPSLPCAAAPDAVAAPAAPQPTVVPATLPGIDRPAGPGRQAPIQPAASRG